MVGPMEAKVTIRHRMLERRRGLDPDDAAWRSACIRERLWEFPRFRHATLVLTYVSSKDNEVDTRLIMEKLLAEGRAVAVPAVEPGNLLTWHTIDSPAQLKPGAFGIPEPDRQMFELALPNEESVALVPGIAFSRDGHRAGFGGGYFDRFLLKFPGTSIGLAYDFQVVASLPHEPHDVSVDFIVTESTVHICG